MAKTVCQVYDCALLEYDAALSLQMDLARLRSLGRIPDTLLLLEHPPTYTLGRKSKKEHFFVPQNWITEKRVTVRQVDRGGEITFHGPGQLVGYPIIQLHRDRKGVVGYIRKLEKMLQLVLAAFDIKGEVQKNTGKKTLTGIWVNEEKIAAIGIRVDIHMITTHGFALNVNPDLTYFKKIVPCGIGDKSVGSMAGKTNPRPDMHQVKEQVIRNFATIFGYDIVGPNRTKSEAFLA